MPNNKYVSGDIRNLISSAIETELKNLPATLAEVKDPIKRVELLTKLMPFVCSPVKPVSVNVARIESGEDKDLFSL
tara:strand:- start:40 stop:267 length:228 start_codon:yes stop_codon:yes gene_type:complete